LRQALTGRFRAHHAFLVSQLLAHLDYLDEAIETVSSQIDTVIAPFAEELARLDTIHGVNQRTAEVLIAEIGVDMTVFPTAKHLASWAGLCPGNNEAPVNTTPARRSVGRIEGAWGVGNRTAVLGPGTLDRDVPGARHERERFPIVSLPLDTAPSIQCGQRGSQARGCEAAFGETRAVTAETATA
jgi:transposase IS116/IS110/IS902 family protein